MKGTLIIGEKCKNPDYIVEPCDARLVEGVPCVIWHKINTKTGECVEFPVDKVQLEERKKEMGLLPDSLFEV